MNKNLRKYEFEYLLKYINSIPYYCSPYCTTFKGIDQTIIPKEQEESIKIETRLSILSKDTAYKYFEDNIDTIKKCEFIYVPQVKYIPRIICDRRGGLHIIHEPHNITYGLSNITNIQRKTYDRYIHFLNEIIRCRRITTIKID